MALLNVNKEKCIKDGICASVCPRRIIKIDDSSRLPQIPPEKEELCIKCGHCVCVCPTGALSLDSMRAADCVPLKKGWRLDPEAIEQFLKGRRSIRNYKDTPVTAETIEKLIDIARYAPSGINRHPVRWAIIDEKVKVRELARLTVEWMRALVKEGSQQAASFHFDGMVRSWDKGYDNVLRDAPALAMAYALKDDPMGRDDCVIALTYLELAALGIGLGACWAGYVTMAMNASPDARKFAGLSARTACHGAMMLGYPKFEFRRIPARNRPHIRKV